MYVAAVVVRPSTMPSAAVRPCRPSKVIFADEISTGLDSSTTFQIVQSFSNLAHMRKVPPHFGLGAFIVLQL